MTKRLFRSQTGGARHRVFKLFKRARARVNYCTTSTYVSPSWNPS